MDYSYIAGFFDGEGSAMILTVKRKNNIFRFHPIIKIAQATTEILHEIREKLGFGKVVGNKVSYVGKKRTACYVVTGKENITKFVDIISPYVVLKKKQLILLKKVVSLQVGKNRPYTKKEFEKIMSVRDEVYKLNCKTRSGLSLKYPQSVLLEKHNFIDIKEWKKKRSQNGLKALISYQKEHKIPREKIPCKCGCGILLDNLDKKARGRGYIVGHNQKNKHWKWHAKDKN